MKKMTIYVKSILGVDNNAFLTISKMTKKCEKLGIFFNHTNVLFVIK